MTNTGNCEVAVIGGGAAGIFAAISAARSGSSVVILEKMPKLGKKILASGGGRCNLSNEKLDSSYYNPEAKNLVDFVFGKFGGAEVLSFFRELGLEVFAEDGRIFPVTHQAASVMEVLEMELARLGVRVECQCEVSHVTPKKDGFSVRTKMGRRIDCREVILCGGGKSYPSLGSDGSAYDLAARFHHTIIEPVPSTVPLTVNDPWCHALQGQRIAAKALALIDGEKVRASEGELLFTKYGLSGTAILDISEEISIAFHRKHQKNIELEIDLIPFMKEEDLRTEISKRMRERLPAAKLTAGLLPPKFGPVLAMEREFHYHDPGPIARLLKMKFFKVDGTRGWNEAEFTAGGVDLSEIKTGTLESKRQPGLYLAGEVLNVNGRRGGYNLAWAWASGYVAGARG